jgi:uncharacterized membrane protein YraQ (UPF0718 family)
MAILYTLFWGGVLRGAQCLLQAAPFILTGLVIAGVFRRLLGPEAIRTMFGHGTRSAIPRAWAIGMVLPICSLGAIPVAREMRRAGLSGGTILAFALAAPLFNPLSLLYGLTLSEPITILAFGLCTLVVVTVVGLIWDRLFPNSGVAEVSPQRVPYGLRRMLAVAVVGAREIAGPSLLFIAVGMLGVVGLSCVLPQAALQRTMSHTDPWAPLLMAAIAVPAYATPLMAMSQLAAMFQHGNSVGAAFTLLTLGAGTNLGLVLWMHGSYGWRRTAAWLGLLLFVVLALSYSIEKPLYPSATEPADHTPAFDIYCRPFEIGSIGLAKVVWDKLRQETQVHEFYGAAALVVVLLVGIALRLLDRRFRIEDWLERPDVGPPANPSWYNASLSAPTLGFAALVVVVGVSIVGCYTYYPPQGEAFEEIHVARTETLAAALAGDRKYAEHWIPIYSDWVRKLQVGVYLRTWHLSDYQRATAKAVEDKLDLLAHELAAGDNDAVHSLVADISRAEQRMEVSFSSKTPFHFAFEDGNALMPATATAEAARDLYLTPKGLYTAEDIAANGSITAAEKYQGFHSAHNFKPKPGDRICPVTQTKANPQCTWIVGGKKYLFCCPPCIDEFMKLARESPAKIKSPEEYVKQ